MLRILYIFLLLAFASTSYAGTMVIKKKAAAGGDIALVGSATVSTDGTNQDRTVGSGNLLVIATSWEDSTNPPTAATVGGVSASATATAGQQTTLVGTKLFYFPNTTAGSKTISVTFGSGAAVPAWVALEFSNIATSNPLDLDASTGGFGTSVSTTNSSTSAVANEVLVTIVKNYTGSTSNPSSSPSAWTEIYDGGASPAYGTEVQYLIVSSTGVYNGTGAWSSDLDMAVSFASFKGN